MRNLLQQIQTTLRFPAGPRPHERESALTRDNSSEMRVVTMVFVFPLLLVLVWIAAPVSARPAVLLAMSIIVGCNLLGWLLPWSRLPRWTESLPPLVTVAASWLLAASAGGAATGYVVLALPPLLWLVLYADTVDVAIGVLVFAACSLSNLHELIPGLPPQGELNSRVTSTFVLCFGALAVRPLVNELRSQVGASRRATYSLRASQAALAHDLRTPLTAVCGLSSLLEQRLEDPDDDDLDRAREYARRIGELSWHAEDTIRGVLDLSRAGELLPSVDDIDVRDLLHEVARTNDRVALVVGDVPQRVVAHGSSLRRVFANLFDNAARHGSDATGVARVTVTGASIASGWAFEFSDDGPGIPEHERAALFDPWQRGTAALDGGYGLGLAIVSAVIAQHGGEITIDDSPSGGACFRFTLDRSPAVEAAAASSDGARTSTTW
jgi:signal transduction histidine kinase